MRTLILCGGKGTRAYPHTVDLPKPLLEVAGVPVLRHVMDIFAAQGHSDFVLAAGYRAHLIEEFAATTPPAWKVEVVDTGEETNTGGRLAACAPRLGDRFFVTYADGLGNVNLAALLAWHDSHPGSATVTTVPLPSQYGTLEIGGDGAVGRFIEKPLLLDHWINGGFFVMDVRAVERHAADDLERQMLPSLAAAGELFAYRHTGFWKSMDTYKDAVELSSLCEGGRDGAEGIAPWLRSPAPAS